MPSGMDGLKRKSCRARAHGASETVSADLPVVRARFFAAVVTVTGRGTAVSLARATGTSIVSPAVTSTGSFGDTENGWRASMWVVSAPRRPSSVWAAARTR